MLGGAMIWGEANESGVLGSVQLLLPRSMVQAFQGVMPLGSESLLSSDG